MQYPYIIPPKWKVCFYLSNLLNEFRALSDAGLGDSHKPKKYTSYWCSICKHALCIDPCFRLYHTEKDYTSEIIKIVRHSVKPIQKDVQHVSKRCSTCLKRQPNPREIIYVLTVWQLGHIVHILKYVRVAFKFIMSSYCQWSHSVVSYIGQVL